MTTTPSLITPAAELLTKAGLTLSELHDHTSLPACFIQELILNNMRPDTKWAADLLSHRSHKQVTEVIEMVTREMPRDARPYVCLHTTVQFLAPGRAFKKLGQIQLQPRTWPNISFVERDLELWEVTGGEVFWGEDERAWLWRHRCYRNTDLARHFRGVCRSDTYSVGSYPAFQYLPSYCVPCRQLEFIQEHGHSCFARCQYCEAVMYLVPERGSRVLKRHNRADGQICSGSWSEEFSLVDRAEVRTP